jgi:hypothetical protein
MVEQHIKLKKDEQHEYHQQTVVNAGAREGSAVPTTYKTPAILLIYTVKCGESLGSDRG